MARRGTVLLGSGGARLRLRGWIYVSPRTSVCGGFAVPLYMPG